MCTLPELHHVFLSPHSTARDQAIAKTNLSPGSVIVSVEALATALIQSEKGRRCDECHIRQSEDVRLRKCTGCASYWYCGVDCQSRHWKEGHVRMCKRYNKWTASSAYLAMHPHEQMDATLLSHLSARWPADFDFTVSPDPAEYGSSSPFATFMSLLPGPSNSHSAPSLCPMTRSAANTMIPIGVMYARFGNNNFAIHSHLRSYAHGIFPLASRLFNHSCVPNAAARYIIRRGQPVMMDVVALRDIAAGEEICIPYADPALLQTRQKIFELSYGFRCTCTSCAFLARIKPFPAAPVDESSLTKLEESLRRLVFPSGQVLPLPTSGLAHADVPPDIWPLLNEAYLERLSARFSKAAHGGDYVLAEEAGMTLLAYYVLIYPPNYPQIGMHILELVKTLWNACVVGSNGQRMDIEQVRSLLGSSQRILRNFGVEGDEHGPLMEIQTLHALLDAGA